jgi:plastocyanin
MLVLRVFIPAIMLAVFACGAMAQIQSNGTSQTTPMSWTVLVGGQAAIEPGEYGPAGAWQLMRFYPVNTTINAGDTIVWKLASSEPHTVTFPESGKQIPSLIIPEGNGSTRMLFNPLAILPQSGLIYNKTELTGSGQMDVAPNFPKEYNLTFAETGSFEYFCAFHNMMKGRVTVQQAGTPYPKTQEQINSEASKLMAVDMEAALKVGSTEETISNDSNKDGTTKYEVRLGYGDGKISRMRFIPTNITIKAGDSIEWIRNDVEMPHTVSFLSGGKEPELVLPEPQERGPPKFVLNPVVLMPAGGNTYNGTGYFNSGIIWGSRVPMPGPSNYTLSFDKPGTYDYICILHDYMGMKGRITVLKAGERA